MKELSPHDFFKIFHRQWKNGCVFSIGDVRLTLPSVGEYVTIHIMKQRTIGFPKGGFFLFGPRGTGKTVWLGQQFPEALLDVFSRFLETASFSHGSEEIDGMALEGLVLQHLRAWLDYSGERNALYFWRTRSGVEVDFIIYTPREFVAIEVKNAAKVKSSDLAALKTLMFESPPCQWTDWRCI